MSDNTGPIARIEGGKLITPTGRIVSYWDDLWTYASYINHRRHVPAAIKATIDPEYPLIRQLAGAWLHNRQHPELLSVAINQSLVKTCEQEQQILRVIAEWTKLMKTKGKYATSPCPLCNRPFKLRGNLIQHFWSHLDEHRIESGGDTDSLLLLKSKAECMAKWIKRAVNS